MADSKKLISDFKDKKKIYEECRDKYVMLIKEILNEKCLKYHTLEPRVKEENNLKKKIEDKNKYKSIDEITDIVGLRIITFYEDDVYKIAEEIKKHFTFDEKNSIDKKNLLEDNKFGYLSLHYVVSISKERELLTEYKKFKDIKVEVQIRSIMQHAWAEIEHDFGYKSESGLPPEIKRGFYRLAALVEVADKEFMRLRNEINNHYDNAKSNVKKNIETELDSISLDAYINNSTIIVKILNQMVKIGEKNSYQRGQIAPVTIDRLKLVGINSTVKLDNLLNIYKDKIIEFYRIFNSMLPTSQTYFKSEIVLSILYIFFLETKVSFEEFINPYGKYVLNPGFVNTLKNTYSIYLKNFPNFQPPFLNESFKN